MFRLMFKSKIDKKAREIHVLDKVYSDFNMFTVDPVNNKLRVSLEPNVKNGHYSRKEMIDLEKERWNWKHLNYTIDDNGNLEMDIPENHEVLIILK